jgi:hypothetical protein
MADQGWISIHRGIQDNWLWKDEREFSRLEAWLDILLNVNHSPKKVLIKNTLIEVGRGESLRSLDTWGKRWNWNKSRVRRFFNLLQKDSMIVTKNVRVTTLLTVCKYDSYQTIGNASETQMKRKRNASETQMTPNNNVNNDNNDNNENKEIKQKEKRLLEFETFWNLYNKKKGTKQAKDKFLKLPQKDVDKILLTVKSFVDSIKDKQFQPLPTSYLNGERWNDEISEVKNIKFAQKIFL